MGGDRLAGSSVGGWVGDMLVGWFVDWLACWGMGEGCMVLGWMGGLVGWLV